MAFAECRHPPRAALGLACPRLDPQQATNMAIEQYDSQLRVLLEPSYMGQWVAIHPESGDYAVGRSSPVARRALFERYPRGMIVTMSIGPEEPDPALHRRLLGAG